MPFCAPRTARAGFVAAYLLGRSLQAAQPGHAVAFFTVVLGVPLIVAMIFIVAAEALMPSGTGQGRWMGSAAQCTGSPRWPSGGC